MRFLLRLGRRYGISIRRGREEIRRPRYLICLGKPLALILPEADFRLKMILEL